MTNQALYALLEQEFRPFLRDGSSLRQPPDFDDDFYYLPPSSEIQRVFDSWELPYPSSEVRVFDCEDYAYSAKVQFALYRLKDPNRADLTPFAFGMIWGFNLPTLDNAVHAVNFIVTDDMGIMLIDMMPGSKFVTPLAKASPNMVLNYIVI